MSFTKKANIMETVSASSMQPQIKPHFCLHI